MRVPFLGKSLTVIDPPVIFTDVPPFDAPGSPPDPSVRLTLGQIYARSAPAQSVISTLARGVSGVTFRVVLDTSDGQRPVRDQRLEKVINDPVLLRAMTSDLSVYGDCFAAVVDGRQLVRLPSELIQVNGRGMLITDYRLNGVPYQADEVCRAAHYSANATTLLRGASPLESLRSILMEDIAAYQAMKAEWEGAGVFVKRPLEAPEWGNRARTRFEQKLRERMKSGTPPVLEESMDLAGVPQGERTTAFVDSRRLAYDACCSVYGVPSSMVAAAVSDRNADASQRSFAVDAVLPVAEILAQAFTEVAVPKFYADNPRVADIKVVVDLGDAGRDRFAQRMNGYRAALGAPGEEPIFTVDEIRQMEGLGPKGGA